METPHCRLISPLVSQKMARKFTNSVLPVAGHPRISIPTINATMPRMRLSHHNLCTRTPESHLECTDEERKHILQMYCFCHGLLFTTTSLAPAIPFLAGS